MFLKSSMPKVIMPTTEKEAKSADSTKNHPPSRPQKPPVKECEAYPRSPPFSCPPVEESQRKSVLVTYICWLFGGIFGVHHLYLHRDRQAFVWWSTLGGYFGVGWLYDALLIPSMVREANMDPRFVDEFNQKLLKNPKKPSFSINRFVGAFLVSYIWGQVMLMAVPEDAFHGVNLMHLHWFIPLFVAVGVWTVGNMGREKGTIWHCLLVAYLVYLIRFWVYEEEYWFTATVFCSAMAFEQFSKEWRLEKPQRKSKKARAVPLILAVVVFIAILTSWVYFNGKVTDAEGDEVPLHEALQNFLNSPWWNDLKQTWADTRKFAEHNGWYETWKQVVDQMDVDGEKNAYKVLGIGPTATQAEVTARWRKLSRENHPDKVKDPNLQKDAQDRFMEIQQAYEALSKVKNKRRQKNKHFSDDL